MAERARGEGQAQPLAVEAPVRARRPLALLEGALDQLDGLLGLPAEEEPCIVAPPVPRTGLRYLLMLDRRLIVPATLLFGLFCFCVIRQTDYDWWWHLRIGHDIWIQHAVPAVDTYSFTRTGQPFVAHEWLFELLTYLGYQSIGYRGLVIAMGAIVFTTYLLHYLLLRALGVGRVLGGLLTGWTIVMTFMAITLRPHLFSLLFLSIELWCLYLYRGGRRRAIWLLPPLTLLWANIHGAWIMGLGTLALFIVGEWLNARARGERAMLSPALGALALATAAVVVNPQGPALYLYPFNFIGAGSATIQYIQEWQPPNFHDALGFSFGLSVMALVLFGLRRRRFDYTLALWTLAFTYLGFSSQRHVPLYALVVIPILAQQLPAAWRGPEWPYRENRLTVAANWVLLLAVCSVVAGVMLNNPYAQLGATPNLKGYPTASLAYLRDHPGGNLLNEDGFGGYLITELGGTRPVFIDTRVDFYGRDFLDQYITVIRLRPGWQDVLQQYNISLVLLPPDTPLVTVLRDDPHWRVAVAEDDAVLLERVGP
ncbi:MAG: hypothetical protein ACTHMU_07510 [Thermomicrobiales bacterium]